MAHITEWQIASLPQTDPSTLFIPHPAGGLCVAAGADQRHFRKITLAADGTVLSVDFHDRSQAMKYVCDHLGDWPKGNSVPHVELPQDDHLVAV